MKTSELTSPPGVGALPPAPAMELVDISKAFPGVLALQGVNLTCLPGEVHALVGENGSGKSTLIKVASGSLRPDSGELRIAGSSVTRPSPLECRQLGLVTSYQDTALIGDLTVAENITLSLLGRTELPLVATHDAADELLSGYELPFTGTDKVSTLSPGSRQILETLRALAHEPRVLLLDEPTAALDTQAVELLEQLLATATGRGAAVLYISHRLEEIRRLATRLTVLRDGRIVSRFEGRDWSAEQIVAEMVGTPTNLAFPRKPGVPAGTPETLRVDDLSGPAFRDVSVVVHRGEIVGVAGSEGNGQRELVRAAAGLSQSRGRVTIGGRLLRRGSAPAAVRAGIAFQSGDRANEAAFSTLSVSTNATVGLSGGLGRFGLVSTRRAEETYEDAASRLAIKAASPHQPIGQLSGGNQQKVVLARAVLQPPQLLIIDEPTQGVDARARLDIYRELRQQADDGTAVLLCSSDSFELAGLCDRVYTFSRGQVVAELTGDQVSEETIVDSFVNAHAEARSDTERAARPAGRLVAAIKDQASLLLLLALTVAVGIFGAARSDAFLTSTNISSLFVLAFPLLIVAAAQQTALLLGVFDISVGANISVTVCVASFTATSTSFGGAIPGLLVCLGVGALIGVVNAFLVQGLGLNAIIATIGTMAILQGLAVIMRPQPGGFVSFGLTDVMSKQWGPVPIAFIATAVLLLVLQALLTRTTLGLRARATGLGAEPSRRMGVKVVRNRALAFVACGVMASLAGIVVASQVGVGSNAVGTSYGLTSVTVCFLAGATLNGGRGSYVAVLLGAIFVSLMTNIAALANIRTETIQMLTGGLTLLAVAFQAQRRPGGIVRLVGRR